SLTGGSEVCSELPIILCCDGHLYLKISGLFKCSSRVTILMFFTYSYIILAFLRHRKESVHHEFEVIDAHVGFHSPTFACRCPMLSARLYLMRRLSHSLPMQ